MNLILLEPVTNLGDLGDEVAVKGGYGRNFLIPQGKAVRVTPENRTMFDERRAELERAALARLSEAEQRAEGLRGLSVTISAKVGEEGKLYGSVGTRDIAKALTGNKRRSVPNKAGRKLWSKPCYVFHLT